MGKIWIQNVGDIDFEVISVAENSNKFQKTRFWKERSVEDMVTLGPTAQATLVFMWSFCFYYFCFGFLAFQGSRSSQKHKFRTCIINYRLFKSI